MQFTDTHTHLFAEQFDEDREAVIKNAISKGVNKLLLPNIDIESIQPMLELCEKYPENCLPMMGLHPGSVDHEYLDKLRIVETELQKEGKYVAVGEIGLDYYWDKTYINEQKEAFRQQVVWAKLMKLPVVIHTRDSFDDAFEIISEEKDDNLKGVFHCFTGTLEDAEKIMALKDFYLGIGGVVTFKNSGVDKIVKDIPLEYLVLETDSPYLAPVPYRGKRNESAYILEIANKLAEIHGVSLEDIACITTANASKLFKIS